MAWATTLKEAKKGIEVALLQETHLSQSEHDKRRFKQFSSSCSQCSKRGVVTLISNKLHFECIQEIKDREGRFVLIKGFLQGTMVTIINVYAPPVLEWKFYKHIFELITVEAEGTSILGGDLNIRLNPSLD